MSRFSMNTFSLWIQHQTSRIKRKTYYHRTLKKLMLLTFSVFSPSLSFFNFATYIIFSVSIQALQLHPGKREQKDNPLTHIIPSRNSQFLCVCMCVLYFLKHFFLLLFNHQKCTTLYCEKLRNNTNIVITII